MPDRSHRTLLWPRDTHAFARGAVLPVITLAFLAGCSGGDSVAPPASESAPVNEESSPPRLSPDDNQGQSPGSDVSPPETAPPAASTVTSDDNAPRTEPVSPAPEPTPAEVPEVERPGPTVVAVAPGTPQVDDPESSADAAARLEAQLDAFTIPPAWIADVRPQWNTNKPWKEARQEIRRLLGLGDDKSRREGIRLTWDYLQKNDIGDRHEYGMYMFLGGEPLWAIKAYRMRLERTDLSYPPFFGVRALASLYVENGVYEEAEQVLQKGMTLKSPDPKWNEMRTAEMHDSFGDLYAAWGKLDLAKQNYREAVRLYPLGKPPYGRHLLPRNAKKVQSKLDLLDMQSLEGAALRDGQYREKALGYSGDVNLTVTVAGGRISDIRVQHQEKIDQNACKLIPERIVQQQSLLVDGVTGATVTKDAIVAGTLRVLKKAGLQ